MRLTGHQIPAGVNAPVAQVLMRPLLNTFYHFRYFLAAATANMKSQPDQRHVFKVSTTNSNENPKCLSCEKRKDLSKCEFAKAKISPNFTHFFMDCLGPEIPYSILVPIDSENNVTILEENEEIRKKLDKVDLPKSQFMEYPILDGNVSASVKLLKPPCFNEKEKYPLIVKV